VPLFSWWARHPATAAILAEMTGRQPFCIGQAVFRGSDHDVPRMVGADHPWAAEHGIDAVLVHVRGSRPRRPEWIDEGRRPVWLATDGATLVQAFPEAEGPEAVPADQAIARGEPVLLALVPGSYVTRGVDDLDRPIWQR
jgi:hypothetical protein